MVTAWWNRLLKPGNESDLSQAAGVAYFYVPPEGGDLEVCLVLTKYEEIPQKDGGIFKRVRSWALPIGGFDPAKGDKTLRDTARREALEEAGLHISPEDMEDAQSISFEAESDREGSERHETRIYCVITHEKPKAPTEFDQSEIEAVEMMSVRNLPISRTHRGAFMESHKHQLVIRYFAGQIRWRKKTALSA